ncbi:tail fiber protein [Ulvibacter litoralis]|uniref:Uncharacterized protein n=1 Tax=Ulvibacter litoralis TaxID=227084 RepID=A0A1G7IN79_9FLAO|nr:tail fiber protein [Ulvibacter litoralis]GHC61406.1 hypothetical protein GCM10008083_28180 [Ulvibacter litoralis]SDF14075.1 hypothetical protein SAMN05421855_10698 [Ulvibacter litoralis]
MKNILLIALLLLSTISFAQRNKFKNLTEKDGKIGIGTETPDQLLTVKGTIHTQEVVVDLEGAVAPDYVFESYFEGVSTLKPTYEVPTLESIAAFIEANYHLPGVPSAEKMKEEGVALKEMNLLLLEKVEELTLYTLAQQKELNTLKEKVAALEKTMEE